DHPTGVETRLGLTRAYGTFDHPIHFGTFCASLMALLVYAGRSNRQSRKRAGLLTGATFLSLSSAPLLSLALQGALILWDQLTRRLKTRLSLSLIAVAVGYVALDLISTRSPMAILATRLTLDSWTGYYRLFIWEHGMNNVWSAPLLGLGLADWARPWWMVADTVDSYWLVLAMRQGIPSFLVLVIALGLIIFATNRKVRQLPDRHARNLLRGWTMSLVALCLIGLTVHYWNALHTYMFFLIGMGGVFADPVRRTRAATVGSQNQSAHRLQKRNLRVPQPLPEAYALSARETVKGQHPITQAAAGLKRTGTGSRNRQPATSIAHSLKPPPIPRGAS
ncbi:MAG: O-antigen ligase family protein, partial [Pseudomonadota bacterium]